MDTFNLGFHYSNTSISNNSMYLGDWRNKISAKLMPSYFAHLNVNFATEQDTGNVDFLNTNYHINQTKLTLLMPISDLFNSYDDTMLNFSFVSEKMKLSQNAINANLFNNDKFRYTSRMRAVPVILTQESYSPGYTFVTGNNVLSINAILVQQTFSDNSITTSTVQNLPQQVNRDDAFYNINRGTGFNLGFKRNIIAGSYLAFEYISKIRMYEFGAQARNYSESGNFDTPQERVLILGLPIFAKSKLEFAAREIAYSQIDVSSQPGYLYYFRNNVNSFLRPNQVSLDNLVVYSIEFKHSINNAIAWNIKISSGQQATTSSVIYNNALARDTAKYSYKIGLSHNTAIGDFNLFASLANKPILIGSTDFGRFTNTTLSPHIEGVASWSFAF
ncbi:MAG: hypothetical protein L3J53_00685 [Proteobacteria bacterium]|nr:hypothetical protein [Pseudomonadota bacterium]